MNRTVSVLLLVAIVTIVGLGLARERQSNQASTSQTTEFKPDARDVAMLNRMLGSYQAELTVNPAGGDAVSASGTCIMESLNDPELQGARGTISLKMSSGYPYHEYDLLGFHGGDHRLHMLSITCEPVAHDHVFTVKDQDSFSFVWRGIQDGKPATEEVNGRWISADELRLNGINTVNGKQVATSVFDLKRVNQAMQSK